MTCVELGIRRLRSFGYLNGVAAAMGLGVWDRQGVQTSDLHVSGCVADVAQKRWLVLTGGYWVGAAECVPVPVKAGGSEQLVRIGVGAGCTG